MAKHYFGISRGEVIPTIGTSTTSKEVEIVVTDGLAGATKLDVAQMIVRCAQRIQDDRDANIVYP